MSGGFAAGEERWRARLGTLRQVVRQEVVARQVAAHLPDRPPRRVLDIGCGQGTQALALARRGHFVTGLDSSARLLGDFRAALAAEPAEVRGRVRLIQADAGAVAGLFAPSAFGAVLCQGVLMYLADPGPLLDAIAQVVAPGGIVSLLVRNGDALAMRPGLLGDWDSAGQAFDGGSYRNRIGVHARADRLADLTAALARRQLPVARWYGVRVFTDTAASDAPLPGTATLDAIVRCEERAGRTSSPVPACRRAAAPDRRAQGRNVCFLSAASVTVAACRETPCGLRADERLPGSTPAGVRSSRTRRVRRAPAAPGIERGLPPERSGRRPGLPPRR